MPSRCTVAKWPTRTGGTSSPMPRRAPDRAPPRTPDRAPPRTPGRAPPAPRINPAGRGSRSRSGRLESAEFVVALLDHAVARFRHLPPGALQVAERLGDHQAGLVRQPEQIGVLRV